MYAANYAKNGDLKHSHECKAAFGRKDMQCPRCVELANGAASRAGWQAHYYAQQERHAAQIRAHFESSEHKSGKCGVVCTFGEW